MCQPLYIIYPILARIDLAIIKVLWFVCIDTTADRRFRYRSGAVVFAQHYSGAVVVAPAVKRADGDTWLFCAVGREAATGGGAFGDCRSAWLTDATYIR